MNATSPITAGNVETVRATVPALGMDVHPVEVREPGDLEQAFSMIAKDGLGGAVMQCDAMLYNERKTRRGFEPTRANPWHVLRPRICRGRRLDVLWRKFFSCVLSNGDLRR